MVCIKEFMITATALNFIKVVISFDANKTFSKGKALKQNAFDVFDITGPQKCVDECLLRSKCNVVSFDLERCQCELGENETLLQNTTDSNYIFMNNPKSYNAKLGLCHNHLCGTGTKCIPQTSGQTTCMRTECRDPPIIDNASVGRNRAVAESTSYSCNNGYYPHGKNTITCKANGEWTVTSFNCGLTPCRTGFTFVNESLPTMQKFCYKLLTKPVNHKEAFNSCNAEKSTLIKINSTTKMNDLLSLPKGIYFADGTDESSEDDWKYSDGTPLDRSLFGGGEPDGGVSQNCLAFGPHIGLLDSTCHSKRLPLCEYFL